MKLSSAAALASLAAFAATPAWADNLLLTFETVSSFASINQYYNGGTDSAGQTGPALGITFGGDALGLVNDDLGPYFSNAPTAVGVMAPVGSQATMNVAAGFTGSFSFFYTSSAAVNNGVQVWSGLDGTGTLLASFNLAANAQAGGCSDSPYCHFDQLAGAFLGTARSVSFGNAAGAAAFDNVAVSTVPEPTTALMMALGGAGLLLARRRM